ncbi:solute carrier family 35 member F2-like isoform X1 [Phyllopteryx taeniolatus]|uniref:solute carrier family 35 member F2-like isoform X1 n=1 Tax=Phyllopteryx taeniolatus TaxID=161469 RepID=UPI002AD52F57|nr:solute carrier family 35 member F2-like isoform X1 [Phyllopteryx taeniolatus]
MCRDALAAARRLRVRALAAIGEASTRRLARTSALGQVLAALVCGTAVASQYLTSVYHADAPMLQSVLHYALLGAIYTPALLCGTGSGSVFRAGRGRWLQYSLVGLADVEANYAVVTAYRYTTLTSVQLLDCFVIPVVMFLSWWLLKTRYRPVHYAAVCVCLLGVGAMVGADLLAGRDQGSASNVLLGDGLVLLSGVLYGLSNVWQEYAVKNRSRLEFLGMLGLFGTIISTAQMSVLELRQISAIRWSWQVGECHTTARFVGFGLETLPRLLRSALLFGAFACCMLALYSLMPVVVKESSAAAVNLSMLTADVFAIFCGIFIFRYSFSGLYVVSLVAIFIGFITFNAVPTPESAVGPSPLSEEGRHDNASKQEVASGSQEVEQRNCTHVVECTRL